MLCKLDGMPFVEGVPLLKKIIMKARRVRCEFCRGYGHQARHCTSKSALDKHFKSQKIGGEWGKVKSAVYQENIKTFSKEMRERTHDDFKKAVRESKHRQGVTPDFDLTGGEKGERREKRVNRGGK